jgi:hypothetical protein
MPRSVSVKVSKNVETYDATVMLRITREFRLRLDDAAKLLALHERAFGRARKVGRATVVYEAMRRGLPLLETELRDSSDAEIDEI